MKLNPIDWTRANSDRVAKFAVILYNAHMMHTVNGKNISSVSEIQRGLDSYYINVAATILYNQENNTL